MKFSINKELFELSKIFKKNKQKMFIVGGFLRDSYLGKTTPDIDITSFASLQTIEKFLLGTNYVMTNQNTSLQTGIIKCGDLSFDYAMMRLENYEDESSRTPTKIAKAKSLEEDAMRRDFTINALYLEVTKGKLYDPFYAINDIKRKTLKQIKTNIFEEDGLRILRLFRFSAELGFRIEAKTMVEVSNNIQKLSTLSGTRKCKELKLMLSSNERLGRPTKKYIMRCLNWFNKYKIWKEFYLPVNRIKYKIVKKADSENMFKALVLDIVNTVEPRNIDRFLLEFLGENGLSLTSAEIEKISNLVYAYKDVVLHASNKDFFFKYYSCFQDIKPIIKIYSLQSYKKYNFFYNYIKNNKIAIQVSDLAIRGGDIKREYPEITPKRYNYILNELLSKVFDGEIKNDKEDLIKAVGNYDY